MKRALVVDDDRHVASALRRMLVRAGYEVETSHCGEDALSRLMNVRPDVVISDFSMPGMNGIQVLAEVRARLPSAARVLLSGYVPRDLRPCDAVQYSLTKPWTEREFLEVMRQTTGGPLAKTG